MPKGRSYKKGFTLIEVVVALFVFTLLMSSVAGIFSGTFSGYMAARSSQRDTENAQYAINAMAKELRTSSIASPAAAGTVSMVRFYDYSQDICFSYRIQNGNLEVASVAPSDPTLLPTAADKLNFCVSPPGGMGAYTTVTTGVVSGSFVVTPSSTAIPASVGKVTIALRIAEGTKHEARLQTTASLRDYGLTGL